MSAEVPLLRVSGLGVRYTTPAGEVTAVDEVSLEVRAGECLGVVGESGAGKSQLFLAVLGLLGGGAAVSGSARLDGQELVGLGARQLDAVRGAKVGLVFQDPMTALTPHLSIGAQIAEVRRHHCGGSARSAREHALALLRRVQVADPERRLDQYPHELSGGMRQRVMIALALAAGPKLLIADEPTTALDVTIQAQILGLLATLVREESIGLLFITHDLAALAGVADRVAVMRNGRIVEEGAVKVIFSAPRESYTRALLARAAALAAPPLFAASAAPGQPALDVAGLSVSYRGAGGALAALTDVSLSLGRGESLAVVGESGSGKSTLARALLQLLPVRAGRVVWMGEDLGTLAREALRKKRRDLQIIFQDPLGSLDPRMSVAEIIAEPLRVHAPALTAAQRSAAVHGVLARVGLDAQLLGRYPHELSGGQGQRVGIARAMVLEPELLVCDEPVSSLDVTTQAQIVDLLADLQRTSGLSLVFVSHNLGVVRHLCERVLVLYLGRMMELGPTASVYAQPRHPYTQELLAAIPVADPFVQPARLRAARPGEAPSPLSPPSGCVFRTRCPHAIAHCAQVVPPWEQTAPRHQLACHRWREIPSPA